MISAIIFDCFGVLMTDAWLPFKAKAFGHDPDLLEQATNLNKRADAGLIDYREFLTSIAELASITVLEAKSIIGNNVANESLFAYIEELKKDYQIGLLSNASGNWLAEMFTPQQVAAFDAIALSYETRHIKPDPRAYEVIAERLGLPVEECVLVDDQERCCGGARATGMKAILYRDVDQTRAELEQLLKS